MGNGDKISGRAKKAAGDLTDKASLREEGREEERKGEVEEAAARAGMPSSSQRSSPFTALIEDARRRYYARGQAREWDPEAADLGRRTGRRSP